jgi:hypothetical protein
MTEHGLKKFWSTIHIAFTLVLARTFGEYKHSVGGAGLPDYALYKWRGQEWPFPTKALDPPWAEWPPHDYDRYVREAAEYSPNGKGPTLSYAEWKAGEAVQVCVECGRHKPACICGWEVCGRCGIAICPAGGHQCGSCGRDI